MTPDASQVWDMESNAILRKKTICYGAGLQGMPLPITADRGEDNRVVGLAAQVFVAFCASEIRAIL